MNLQKILVVLGAPNSDTGELGQIAKSRLDGCLKIYTEGDLVLCTGGWGEHFNTTGTAHAEYAKTCLVQQGIPESAFLPNALSANSVEDAVKVKRIISEMGNVALKVITSEFHLARVELIFNKILSTYPCTFIGVKTNLATDELNRLVAHEQKAVAAILKNGLYHDV